MCRLLAAIVLAACTGTGPTGADAMADPPPPEGVELPVKYGDLPARPVPESRSSTWTVGVDDGDQSFEVPCDARQVPALRDALNLMFRGGEAEADPPGDDVPVVLEIVWREEGEETSRSRLHGDGKLVMVVGDEHTVQRVLDDERMATVRAQLLVALEAHACPEGG